MKYYMLWGRPEPAAAADGRNYFTLILLIGIIIVVLGTTFYFATIRPLQKDKKRTDEIERLSKLLEQGEITETEFKAKRREIN